MKFVAALLWLVLVVGVALIVVMTWHPWVAGQRGDCPAGLVKGWDGHCYPSH